MSASATNAPALPRAGGPFTAWIGRRAIDVTMAVLLVAGAAKLSDLPAFVASLRSWTLIPSDWHGPVAAAVPSFEVAAAALWFLRLHPRGAIWIAAGLLTAFTATYAAHVLMGQRPSCGCLGAILAFESLRREAWWLISRNVAMIALLLFGAFTAGAARRLPPKGRGVNDHRALPCIPAEGARGFTIIELIVVVMITALLVTLLAPSLRGMRDRARQAVSLSNLRSNAQIFAAYSGDFADILPYFTDPAATATVIRCERASVVAPYFGAHNTWNIALADGYYGGDYLSPVLFAPGYGPEAVHGTGPLTSYWYPCVFLAHPDYWSERTRRPGRSQWRPSRFADVTYPSKKVVLFAFFPYVQGLHTGFVTKRDTSEIALIDASARPVRIAELAPGHPYGDGFPDPPNPTGLGWGHPLSWPKPMHTLGGIRARDVP